MEDAICHFTDTTVYEGPISEETLSAMWQIYYRIEWSRYHDGDKPRVTFKQLQRVNNFIENNW
jgi:hypothetical protein